ncbi:hypothetical protein T05_9127 [Trichinella murrelli]|uniref:Uncharacterized protein n=1 Tax=Trichinella murrelli TaxID=144512 RepID=A0A0V0U4F2_9BILA|nr:hypothetical protein T05_9127 [Trichinella murrelli]
MASELTIHFALQCNARAPFCPSHLLACWLVPLPALLAGLLVLSSSMVKAE